MRAKILAINLLCPVTKIKKLQDRYKIHPSLNISNIMVNGRLLSDIIAEQFSISSDTAMAKLQTLPTHAAI